MLHWLFGSIFFFSNDTTVLLSFEGMPMMDDCSFSDSFRGSFEFLKRLLNEWCTRVRECVYVCWCVCMYRCLYRCPALPFYYSQFFEEEVLEELFVQWFFTVCWFQPAATFHRELLVSIFDLKTNFTASILSIRKEHFGAPLIQFSTTFPFVGIIILFVSDLNSTEREFNDVTNHDWKLWFLCSWRINDGLFNANGAVLCFTINST